MNNAFQSRAVSEARPVVGFVAEELNCPLCESYEVEESVSNYQCRTCGTSWKTIGILR